jgi:hypothetical protein
MGWLEDALKRELREDSIACWNDRAGRTKEEVIAALRGKPLTAAERKAQTQLFKEIFA